MSPKSSIGVAFLGIGRMGETHLRNLLGISGVKIVVVADPRLEAAERGKALAGAEQALTDVEQAITYPGVDAVVIVTPTDTHARLIELAANEGKAVFSEKPIALNLVEPTRVVKVIRERGIPVQLGFMRRFDPGSNWGYDIRTEVAGALGKVVVEAPQKTPLLFAKDFGSSFDHFENFPDRFQLAYRYELESFFVALLEGRKPSPGPEDALETLRLALAARKSWVENRPVKVSEIQA
jgi:myo-inositol 2-dehydrogenase / D-chiro-inositol 1-dehydrogenase